MLSVVVSVARFSTGTVVTFDIALILFVLALLAGLVDTIAGGGGLISLPALLWVGLPPVTALATNKAQAIFGSFTATAYFTRKGAIDPRWAAFSMVCTFLGATAGALLVQRLGSDLPARIVPLLLIAFALYFLFSPRVSDLDSRRRDLLRHGLRRPAWIQPAPGHGPRPAAELHQQPGRIAPVPARRACDLVHRFADGYRTAHRRLDRLAPGAASWNAPGAAGPGHGLPRRLGQAAVGSVSHARARTSAHQSVQ